MKAFEGLRGTLKQHESLAPYTWFKVGGPADYFFAPADEEDLKKFLKQRSADLPIFILGAGSNIIIRDGGVRGCVIHLSSGFSQVTQEGERIIAGAGALDIAVATRAQKAALTGLEFLSGIPGTIGGNLLTNAGAYGGEIKDILISARAVDGEGNSHSYQNHDFHFTYRHADIPKGWIFTEVTLQGRPGQADVIFKAMQAIQEKRRDSQPINYKTGGSTFKNPEGHSAWKLIDEVGCRGLKNGGAMVSQKHTNFLINTGTATAAEIEELGETVRKRVLEKFGLHLHWEIQRLGEPL